MMTQSPGGTEPGQQFLQIPEDEEFSLGLGIMIFGRAIGLASRAICLKQTCES
jgi:hypothetical protein